MVKRGDPGDLALDTLLQLSAVLLITEEDVFKRLEVLNKNETVGHDDIHQVITKPSSDVVDGDASSRLAVCATSGKNNLRICAAATVSVESVGPCLVVIKEAKVWPK